MKAIKRIDVQLSGNSLQTPVKVVAGDTAIQLILHYTDFTIPSGTTATMFVQKPSKKFVYQTEDITVSGNDVIIDVWNQAIIEDGTAFFNVELKNGEDTITTFPNTFQISRNSKSPNAEESRTVVLAFDKLTAEKLEELKASADEHLAQIEAKTQEQITIIQNEAEEQKGNIEAKGAETLASIPSDYTELYNTAMENKKSKAGAIICSASGKEIVVTDSDDNVLHDFALHGKGEQKEYSGKNLFDISGNVNLSGDSGAQTSFNSVSGNILTCNVNSNEVHGVGQKIRVNVGSTITFSAKILSVGNGVSAGLFMYEGGSFVAHNYCSNLNETLKITYTAKIEELTFCFVTNRGTGAQFTDIQVEFGTEATPYEPFTGGQPSPSPDYPQEIVNVGKYNETTGKYEVEVTAKGKNWLEFTGNQSQIVNGVTFTIDYEKGSVHAKGTATASTYCVLSGNYAGNKIPIPNWLVEGEKYVAKDCSVFLYPESGSGVQYTETFIMQTGYAYYGVFIQVYEGETVDKTFYPMIRRADIGDDTFEPYKEHTETLELSEPLRATKDGSVRDKLYLDGTVERKIKSANPIFSSVGTLVNGYKYAVNNAVSVDKIYVSNAGCLCTKARFVQTDDIDNVGREGEFYENRMNIVFIGSTDDTLETFTEKYGDSEIQYILATPIIETLPETEIAKLKRLQTFNPTTIFTNSDDGEMIVDYVADTKIYIDNKFKELETALANTNAQLL